MCRMKKAPYVERLKGPTRAALGRKVAQATREAAAAKEKARLEREAAAAAAEAAEEAEEGTAEE